MKKILSFLLLYSTFAWSGELAIATMFRNNAPYLKEWIEYHKMIGVDHFYLYNDASTDNWQDVLAPYIKEGLVEVFYWPAGKPFWGREQRLACRDGIERAYAAKTKWIALIDSDEFLLPRQDKTIPECLKKHFEKASAVYVNWFCFGTGGVYVNDGDPFLFKLTTCADPNHSSNKVGKSIVRPEWVITTQVGNVHRYPLYEKGTYVNGNGEFLTMKNGSLSGGKQISDRFIRINHYKYRDENYYQNVRIQRDADLNFRTQYTEFNKCKDYEIINFIKKHYNDKIDLFRKKEQDK